MAKVTRPKSLGAAGVAIWRAMTKDLAWDEREILVLTTACRQADDIAAMEAALAEDGVIVTGSKGQQRLNAIVTELRQGRLALAKLLDALEMPDAEDGPPMNANARRARQAATARWQRRDRVEAMKKNKHLRAIEGTPRGSA